jgi:hypothetical protein
MHTSHHWYNPLQHGYNFLMHPDLRVCVLLQAPPTRVLREATRRWHLAQPHLDLVTCAVYSTSPIKKTSESDGYPVPTPMLPKSAHPLHLEPSKLYTFYPSISGVLIRGGSL